MRVQLTLLMAAAVVLQVEQGGSAQWRLLTKEQHLCWPVLALLSTCSMHAFSVSLTKESSFMRSAGM